MKEKGRWEIFNCRFELPIERPGAHKSPIGNWQSEIENPYTALHAAGLEAALREERKTGASDSAPDRAHRTTVTAGISPGHSGVSASGALEHVRLDDGGSRSAGISAHRGYDHQAGTRG